MGPVLRLGAPLREIQMTSYEKAFEFAMKWEGYKSDDPDDPGGRTVFGISARYFPETVKKIWDLPKDKARQEAKEFYYHEFWLKNHCDLLEEKLAITVFDCSINPGPGACAGFLKLTRDWQQLLFCRIDHYVSGAKDKYIRGLVNRSVALWQYLR
jgi:lysozyme family protein